MTFSIAISLRINGKSLKGFLLLSFFLFLFFDGGLVNVLLSQDRAAIRRTYLSLFGANVISWFSYCITLLLIPIVGNVLFFD